MSQGILKSKDYPAPQLALLIISLTATVTKFLVEVGNQFNQGVFHAGT